MKKIFIVSTLIILLFNCTTAKDTAEVTETLLTINESYNSENIDIPKDLITEKSIKEYDLTVLKGSSYPTIKNDTPFTLAEIAILNNEDGLEMKANIEVAHYFKYFLRDKNELLKSWITNARPYIPFIREEFLAKGLPVELIYLPFLESGYNTMAYSRVGAGGIWQFMPRTAASYGLKINWWVDERRSPQLATPHAIKHLSYLNKLFDNWYTALAAYNAGEGRISRAMKKVNEYDYFELIKTNALPKETRRYVPQYLAIVKIMKNLDKLGYEPIDWNITNKVSRVTIHGGTDLFDLSHNIGLSWSSFSELNPAFRRKVSDPSYDTIVIIPSTKKLLALNYVKNNKPITESGYRYYTIRSGDSWSYLSQLTDTSILLLKRLNNIVSNNLKIGQRILLPGKIVQQEQVANYAPKQSTQKLQMHKVRSGDTISSISISYNIKLASLYKVNNLNSRSILKVGQRLYLPGYPMNNSSSKDIIQNVKDVYVVKDGDSIWLIAQKTKVPYKKILTINNFNSNSRLNIGDKIRLD